jgi:hypothetical protein
MQTLNRLRPFDRQDEETFMGVETHNPQIAFSDEYAIIQDGPKLNLVGEQDEWSITLPTAAIAILVGNHLVEGMDACGDDGLKMANFCASLGFDEASQIR